MLLRPAILFHAVLALLVVAGPAAAKPALYRGEYSLSFLGFTIARAAFDSRVDEKTYSIDGKVSSAGLAALFDDTTGTIRATGKISGDATRPDLFRADYVSGKKPALVEIGFAGGRVTRTVNVPPLKKRGSDWIPLGADDLKAAVDPIAATLIRAGSLGEVCGRTVRMYDGELRADLTLEQVSTGKASVPGFSGETVTCRMRFTPVSGYRKGKRALNFLKTRSRIMVAFAELGHTGLYAPIHATVGTEIGTITVRARRFEALP